MQKIYVLLRNEKQTGPYSLEEIIRFDLKPYDLIWIEGKSAGWYYPQEIGALHPYLSFLSQKPVATAAAQPEAKKVFVAMPAEPIKKEPQQVVVPPFTNATSFAPKTTHEPLPAATNNLEEEVYARFKKPVEEHVYTTTPALPAGKKTSAKTVGIAAVAVLVVGAVFAASWIMNRHSNEEETSPVPAAETPVSNEITPTAVANTTDTKSTKLFTASKQKAQVVAQPKQLAAGKQTSLQTASKKPAEKTVLAETGEGNVAAPAREEEQPMAKEEKSATTVETTAAPTEKKKKLRDKIFDIFHKKSQEQKADEQTTEEAKPDESSSGERTSTHRETSANLAQLVSVRFTVPNDWMMGIKNAKATLVNRSNETVAKAVVEVSYYDDDNQLLQKKTISFSKVEGKGSQTISIPDHPSATKVDYNLVSVAGKPGA